jgi:hypothetical protein
VHEVQVFANVFASSLQYQVLETSLLFGATIQPTDDALQITYPPPAAVPKPKDFIKEVSGIHPLASLNT